MKEPLDLRGLLGVLLDHEVDFVVVGGIAAVLEGAPVTTFDLDLVYENTSANVERLAAALEELDARYRYPAGRIIRPDVARLARQRVNLLVTSAGPLDLLQEIGDAWRYADAAAQAIRYDLGDRSFSVLRLEAVIRTKQQAARDKDLAVLPVLLRTLQERDDAD